MRTPKPILFGNDPQSSKTNTIDAAATPRVAHAVATVQSTPVKAITRQDVERVYQRNDGALNKISEQILQNTKASSAGEMGDLLTQIIATAKGIDPTAATSHGFLAKMFHKARLTKEKALAHYQSVQQRIDSLIGEVETKIQGEKARIDDLQKIETANIEVIRERNSDLEKLKALEDAAKAWLGAVTDKIKAGGKNVDFSLTNEKSDAQEMVDFIADRIDNCQRSILLAKQRAPQVRIMLQNTRTILRRFDDIKNYVIPAWKDRLSLYIIQMEQKGAAELANSIFNASDEALRKQAEALQESTEEVAALRRQNIASNDTLEYVNQQLIGTLDSMNKAVEEERQARLEAQKKIQGMQDALVSKLIDPSTSETLSLNQPSA